MLLQSLDLFSLRASFTQTGCFSYSTFQSGFLKLLRMLWVDHETLQISDLQSAWVLLKACFQFTYELTQTMCLRLSPTITQSEFILLFIAFKYCLCTYNRRKDHDFSFLRSGEDMDNLTTTRTLLSKNFRLLILRIKTSLTLETARFVCLLFV